MSRPCTVCLDARRAKIDWRLAFGVINLTQIAHEFGVSRDALRAHRQHHLPGCLVEFQAAAEAWQLGDAQRHVRNVYMHALDALARAERGALGAASHDGPRPGAVSMTEIARQIRAARASLDQLTRVAMAARNGDGQDGTVSDDLQRRLDELLAATIARGRIDDPAVGTDDPYSALFDLDAPD